MGNAFVALIVPLGEHDPGLTPGYPLPGNPAYPSQGPIYGGGYPSHGLPGAPGHPSQGLPGSPGHPSQGPIYGGGYPSHGLPGWPAYPSQGLPGGGYPSQGLPPSAGNKPSEPPEDWPPGGKWLFILGLGWAYMFVRDQVDNTLPEGAQPK